MFTAQKYFRIKSSSAVGRGDPKGVVMASFDPFNPRSISFGFSKCSPQDHYSKELAKTIASGRLKSYKYTVSLDDIRTGAVTEKIAQQLSPRFSEMADDIAFVIRRVYNNAFVNRRIDNNFEECTKTL